MTAPGRRRSDRPAIHRAVASGLPIRRTRRRGTRHQQAQDRTARGARSAGRSRKRRSRQTSESRKLPAARPSVHAAEPQSERRRWPEVPPAWDCERRRRTPRPRSTRARWCRERPSPSPTAKRQPVQRRPPTTGPSSPAHRSRGRYLAVRRESNATRRPRPRRTTSPPCRSGMPPSGGLDSSTSPEPRTRQATRTRGGR